MSHAPSASPSPADRLRGWLKAALPREVVALAAETRRLQGGARWRFLSLRARRALRRRAPLASLRTDATILFVCRGNKLRSPMAEALLRKGARELALDGVTVTSAGTHAQAEHSVPPDAHLVAARHGVSLAEHAPRSVTDALIRDADVVFVMDRNNEAELLVRFPEAEQRVVMLGAYDTHPDHGDVIPDPDNGTLPDLERCYARLSTCVAAVSHGLARTTRSVP